MKTGIEKSFIQVATAGNSCSASSAGIARRGAAFATSNKAKDKNPQKKCPIKCNMSRQAPPLHGGGDRGYSIRNVERSFFVLCD